MAISKLSVLKNKHFLVLTGNGMLSLVGLALTALLFHAMSRSEVGIWFFVQSIIAFCEAGRSGFLSTAAVKFYAGTSPERARIVLGSIWYLAILVTSLVMLVNLCAVPFLMYTNDEEFLLCVQWVGITFLATLPSDVISWKLQAEERYDTMLLFRTINSVCSVVSFAALMIFHKMTLETAFFVNFIINVATSTICLLLRLGSIKSITHRSRECVTELVHYGKFTLGTTMGSNLLSNVDTWIVNFILGPASVAIYNLAMRLTALVRLPLSSIAVTGMSAMAIAFNSDNTQHVTYIFKKYAGMLTMAFIPMAILAFFLGDIAIDLLGGHAYNDTEAANVYKLVMFIAIIFPIETLNGVTLDIIHKTKVNFYKVMLMIIFKVIGDFAGIAIFHNIYGVACSILFVHVLALVYGNYQLQKSLNYTILDIVLTGYRETKHLIFNRLGLSRKTHNLFFTLILKLPFYYYNYISCVTD